MSDSSRARSSITHQRLLKSVRPAAFWISSSTFLWFGGNFVSAQQKTADAPFLRNSDPLNEENLRVLEEQGFHFDDQGKLIPPRSQQPVSKSDFPDVLEEARSRQRLRALLQINIILNRNRFNKTLPDAERESLREIGKNNWGLLTRNTRRDLRRYFSDYELLEMDQKAQTDQQNPELEEPPPVDAATDSAPQAAPVEPTSQTAAPQMTATTPPATPAPETPANPAAAIFAAPAATPAPTTPPALPPISPTIPNAAPAVATIAPTTKASTFHVEAAAPPPVTTVKGFDESVAKISPVPSAPIKTAESPQPAVSVSSTEVTSIPSAPAASATARPLPIYPEFNPETFRAFAQSAPYGNDVKALLQLLTQARAPERRMALGLIQLKMPVIVIDSVKAGVWAARSTTLPGNPEDPRYQIMIHDGPVLVATRTMLLGRNIFRLPDDPEFYKELGLALPMKQAFIRANPWDAEKNERWGVICVYPDGSQRMRFSNEQMAGALLKELLMLDARLRDWDKDDLHVELRAETAQFEFYRDLEIHNGQKPVLDGELAARYQSWLDRPEEYVDFILDAVSAPRGHPHATGTGTQAIAREEISLLQAAGAADSAAARRELGNISEASQDDSKELAQWIKTIQAGKQERSAWMALDQKARMKP